jgi:hypothetical protein
MTTVTKTREGEAWRILFDGRPTPFLIEKGLAAKWGHNQTYDVVDGDADQYLFEAKSVGHAMGAIERIAAVMSREAA